MSQKISAKAMRIGLNTNWNSTWYAKGDDYKKNLFEDLKIRKFLRNKLNIAGLDRVEIRRTVGDIDIEVFVARPGVAIGRGGEGIDDIKKDLSKLLNRKLDVKISEVKQPDLSSRIIARSIADGIERRQPVKLLVASAKNKAMLAGAKGVKIWVAGRIGSASQARTIKVSDGPVPIHTLRAEIDYCEETAYSKEVGLLGIRVWIYKPVKKEK